VERGYVHESIVRERVHLDHRRSRTNYDLAFCQGVVKHAWLTKVGFAVCLVRSTIHVCVHGTVKVVSAPLSYG